MQEQLLKKKKLINLYTWTFSDQQIYERIKKINIIINLPALAAAARATVCWVVAVNVGITVGVWLGGYTRNGDIDGFEDEFDPFDGVITVDVVGVRCEHEQEEFCGIGVGNGYLRDDKSCRV